MIAEAVRRARAALLSESPEEARSLAERALLLQLCYLWPLSCCGFFVPWLVYARYRADEELGPHARQGAVLGAAWGLYTLLWGLLHGALGRLAEDWLEVTLPMGAVTLLGVGALTALGLRWYRLALRDEPFTIPLVSALAERI